MLTFDGIIIKLERVTFWSTVYKDFEHALLFLLMRSLVVIHYE